MGGTATCTYVRQRWQARLQSGPHIEVRVRTCNRWSAFAEGGTAYRAVFGQEGGGLQ